MGVTIMTNTSSAATNITAGVVESARAGQAPDKMKGTLPDPRTEGVDLRDSTEQLGELKHHRSELKRTMNALEAAMARPVNADPGVWLDGVRQRLQDLIDAFDNHIRVHEGPDSFHADIVRTQPHLTSHVIRLQRDHDRLRVRLMSTAELVETPITSRDLVHDIRSVGTTLLHDFARHRQRGADVVWEAFNYDVGGEH